MSKIAVINTGGKQYKVKQGDVIKVEKINKKETLLFHSCWQRACTRVARVPSNNCKCRYLIHSQIQILRKKLRRHSRPLDKTPTLILLNVTDLEI